MILVEAQIHDAMGLLLIMAILFMFFGFLSKPLFRFGPLLTLTILLIEAILLAVI